MGQVLYPSVYSDLPSKKSYLKKSRRRSAILQNQKIEIRPILPYAELRSARENFSNNELSFVLAHLYSIARAYFMQNS